MRAYLSTFSMRWRQETQYRGAVLGGMLCQIFFGLILAALYRALYAGRPQAMPLAYVVTYVWLQQAFFRMLLSTDADLMDKIRTGGIAYDLCRPLNLYGYYYARVTALKLVGSLMRAVPMLLFAALLPRGWGVTPPASAAALGLAALSLAMGLGCMAAMENITMAFTMRTLDQRGVQALLNLLMTLLSGNVLPLTLYPDSWQRALTRLPWAQMLDTPIRLYTGLVAAPEAVGPLMWQAGWLAALVAVGCLLWRWNQRRLVLQGG